MLSVVAPSFMPNIIDTKCHKSGLLCRVSLCWMSLCWMSWRQQGSLPKTKGHIKLRYTSQMPSVCIPTYLPSVHLCICLYVCCVSIYLSVHLSVLSVHPSVLFVHSSVLSVHPSLLSVRMSFACLSVCLSVRMFVVCLSVCLSACLLVHLFVGILSGSSMSVRIIKTEYNAFSTMREIKWINLLALACFK